MWISWLHLQGVQDIPSSKDLLQSEQRWTDAVTSGAAEALISSCCIDELLDND